MTAKIDPGDTNQGRVTFLRHPWVICTPPLTAVPYGAAGRRRAYGPVGHQVLAPTVTQRPLADYDWLGGVGVQEGALSQLAEHVEVAA